MSLSSFHILFAYVRKMDVSQGSSSPSGITLRGRGGGGGPHHGDRRCWRTKSYFHVVTADHQNSLFGEGGLNLKYPELAAS